MPPIERCATETPWVARRLGLELPPAPTAPITLEISSLYDVDADIVEYVVAPGSEVAGRLLRELPIPEGAVVAMIVRDKRLVPPRGSTPLEGGDYVFFLMHQDCRAAVDRIFSG
mgnify:CR=1 FL=1